MFPPQPAGQNLHWTAQSTNSYQFSITVDVTDMISERMEEIGISQKELAARMNLSEGRISQILRDNANPTLATLINLCSAVGLKLGLLPYNDEDPQNQQGPVPASLFLECWSRMGKPLTFDDLDKVQVTPCPEGNPHSADSLNPEANVTSLPEPAAEPVGVPVLPSKRKTG